MKGGVYRMLTFFLHYSYYDYLLFFNVNITIKSLIIK